MTTNGESARKPGGEQIPESELDEQTRRIDPAGYVESPVAEPAHAAGGQAEPPSLPPQPPARSSPPASLGPETLEQPVAYVSLGLTVGDGFKFGCGFALAIAITVVAVFALLSVLFLVASLLGVPVPVSY